MLFFERKVLMVMFRFPNKKELSWTLVQKVCSFSNVGGTKGYKFILPARSSVEMSFLVKIC